MWDFLTFNSFITQDILIFIYYIGAVVFPVVLWQKTDPILGKFSFIKISDENRFNMYLSVLVLFLVMELCWRMMFEVMIGYFDMHDYLYQITQQTKNIVK